MKRENWYSLLIGAVLAFCISFGGIACILTGFDLCAGDDPVVNNFYTVPVDMVSVLVFCALFSLAAAAAFALRRGEWVLLGAIALVLGYLWRTGDLISALEAMLYRITYIYDLAYHFGVARWTGNSPADISADIGFFLLAGFSAMAAAWTVCRQKNGIFAVLPGCLLLGLCLVVTNTVPDTWCLVLLLTGLVLLVLTNAVRRRSQREGNRLTALMLVPAVLYMGILFWTVPRENYAANDNPFQQTIMQWLSSLPLGDLLGAGVTGDAGGTVNLSTLGQRVEVDFPVMDVVAAKDGLLYLRGQSLDSYEGTSWSASDVSSEPDGGWPMVNCKAVGTVTVSMVGARSLMYFPYYPSGANWPASGSMKNGALSNPYRQWKYSFEQMEMTGPTDAILSKAMREQCLQLPISAQAAAAAHLQKIGNLSGNSNDVIAKKIEKYVSESARYDLNSARMPSYEDDFAIWFLENAETGYCVHFASAAAVLLRAAGVPARYVSGYVVKAEAGREVTVTQNRAHAWVEYFMPGYGWKVLDPTPSSWYDGGGSAATEPTEPTPSSEATQPQPTTEPVVPPESSSAQPSQGATETVEHTGSPQEPEGPADLSWLVQLLKWLGIFAGVCVAAASQHLLRKRRRGKRMHTGHPNQRTLYRWKYVLRMSKILKEQPPQQLYELAEKAKFSQHTVSVSERMEFDRYLNDGEEKIAKMPCFKRWLIRLIWAI